MLETLKSVMWKNRRELLIALFILIMGIAVGGVWGKDLTSGPAAILVRKRVTPVYDAQPIIINNLKACLFLAAGFLTLGVTTVFALLFNGIAIGTVLFSNLSGLSSVELLLRLLPHGIVEIPGAVVASAAGFQSLKFLINILRGEEERFGGVMKNTVILIALSSILIIFAGILEAYVTTIFI